MARQNTLLFSLLCALVLSGFNKASGQMPRKDIENAKDYLHKVFTAYHHTTFRGRLIFDGNTLEEFSYSIGRSPDEYDKLLNYYDQKDFDSIDSICEEHARNGVWIKNIEFVAKSKPSPHFKAGWVKDVGLRNLPISGVDFPLGFFSFSRYSIQRFDRRKLLDRLEVDETGNRLKYETDEVDYYFEFSSRWKQLNKIEVRIHRTLDSFSGKYDEDGKAILDSTYVEKTFEYRDIVIDEQYRIRSLQLYYLDSDEWRATQQIKIDNVSALEGELSDSITFSETVAPKLSSVYFANDISEYEFVDGKIVRLFDATAFDVLSGLNPSTELKLTSADSIEFQRKNYLRKSAARHCGIYSAIAAILCLGSDIDLSTVFDESYQSTEKGSSAADLVTFFEDRGFNAKTYSGGSRKLLERIAENGDVALLHFGNSNQGREINHWVTFSGIEDDKVTIIDLPRSTEQYSFAEVFTDWDGIAVVVSQGEIEGYSNTSFLTGVWPVLIATLVFFLWSVGGTRNCFATPPVVHCC